MRLPNLVWKELRERPSAMLTSGLTILLGVAAVVAIRHVTVHRMKKFIGNSSLSARMC